MQAPDTATFAMGCFWSPEVIFRNVPGVVDADVGYTGGHTVDPTYEDVCAGETGHAEAVRVRFDPQKVSFDELLEVFFREHDVTQVNRQGPDVGSQYRSAIFYHDEAQREAASRALAERQSRTAKRVATQLAPAGPYYRAEDYHQQYLVRRGLASCRI
jgi:peptide-methionine (S)-S-oxide reductase